MKCCEQCEGMIHNYPCPYCGFGEYDGKNVTEVKENGLRDGKSIGNHKREARFAVTKSISRGD